MDTAVALVQAYLNVNGYFTVAEYPVLESVHRAEARMVTDLDILAVRFAGAGHRLVHGAAVTPDGFGPDPVLGAAADRPDMIVGEVKEGRARFNSAARNPAVLQVALARFGCCSPADAQAVTQELLAHGRAAVPGGHLVRMVAFGDASEQPAGRAHAVVAMRHVVEFLQGYLRTHWPVLRHTRFNDAPLAVLALMEKGRVDTSATAAPSAHESGGNHDAV